MQETNKSRWICVQWYHGCEVVGGRKDPAPSVPATRRKRKKLRTNAMNSKRLLVRQQFGRLTTQISRGQYGRILFVNKNNLETQ
ncbi:hypothetical protein PHMEG_00035181 [Phytophthora megakarya]|uniref:Uncharacterized protein n=1 Tax=Phytophthora megakarya TaxID=4795 RepID=A0A225UPB6_9STRA|nr:hypothetical protein PHMEG_00035181 [Phytophthora megakarya]